MRLSSDGSASDADSRMTNPLGFRSTPKRLPDLTASLEPIAAGQLDLNQAPCGAEAFAAG